MNKNKGMNSFFGLIQSPEVKQRTLKETCQWASDKRGDVSLYCLNTRREARDSRQLAEAAEPVLKRFTQTELG